MIIFRDITTENKDEIMSDTFKIIDVGDGLWEIDGKMVTKGGDNFVLEGANASAEGEDADEGGEAEVVKVIDIIDTFRLNEVAKPSKKTFTADMKKYLKKVLTAMKEKGESEEKIKEFQACAQNGIKKILANFDDYDLYMGESMEEASMPVLVNYREDGVTPYVTIWKHGLEEYKV